MDDYDEQVELLSLASKKYKEAKKTKGLVARPAF